MVEERGFNISNPQKSDTPHLLRIIKKIFSILNAYFEYINIHTSVEPFDSEQPKVIHRICYHMNVD